MKRLIITEEQAHALSNIIGQNQPDKMPEKTGPYTIDPEKVLLVKKYLNTYFSRGNIETVGPDGFPAKTRIATMVTSAGNPLLNIGERQLEDMLIEKFKNMFVDKIERQKFIHQVMDDWFTGNIGIFGNLSVNLLK